MGHDYVVITGIAGNLGRLLAKRLHKEARIIGIDRRPFDDRPKDVIHHQIDIRRKKAEEIFRSRQIGAVFHMGTMHNPRQPAAERYSWNILGTTKILEFCRRYRIPKFVFLSSADVYGPNPANPNFLTEDAPLQGWRDSGGGLRDLVEADMLVQSFFWKDPDTDIIILRPVHIVGPNVRNAPTRYFNLGRAPVLAGFNPMVQLIHEDDLTEALALCLRRKVRGIFNIEGAGAVPVSEVLSQLAVPTFSVPHPLLHAGLRLMWKWHLTSFPAGEMDFLRYICMVDGTRAREELGFVAKKSMHETIKSIRQRG
ncbi:MAG: SDR family oxidoreductase [Deltaproteobacteria bacterium]|nr:SDR family oxidoreductase [Deltaproteobacteria bacterium]